MGRYDHIQDFACRISDLIWGGDLGWDRPNGLTELAESVRRLRDRAKADEEQARALREALEEIANRPTQCAAWWQEIARQALQSSKGETG